MKNVVVFGGSGFLGSHAVEALAKRGYSVTVFDRRRSPHLNGHYRFIGGDIMDSRAVEEVVSGADAVFNFAGLADLDEAVSDPIQTVQQNIMGTTQILEACRHAGVKRFVYASTVYVFSDAGSFYRCSKQACEQYILEYQRQYGLDFTILRYGSLYGDRANEKNAVYRFLKEALTTRQINYHGEPDFIREYIHVADAARLSAQVLDEKYRNEYLIITGTQAVKVKQLFDMISEMLGYPVEVNYRPYSKDHYRITPYSFNPKIGKKLVDTSYLDMGQGLLHCLQEIHDSHVLSEEELPVLQTK